MRKNAVLWRISQELAVEFAKRRPGGHAIDCLDRPTYRSERNSTGTGNKGPNHVMPRRSRLVAQHCELNFESDHGTSQGVKSATSLDTILAHKDKERWG